MMTTLPTGGAFDDDDGYDDDFADGDDGGDAFF